MQLPFETSASMMAPLTRPAWRGLAFTILLGAGLSSPMLRGEDPADQAWTDPQLAAREDPDFSIQGEYGSADPGSPWGLQVVALGGGRFDAWLLEGGLPGAGWAPGKQRLKLVGRRDGDTTELAGTAAWVTIREAVASIAMDGRKFQLPRIRRESPTLGAKAPAGAKVLFDGRSADAWIDGQMEGDLLVNSDVLSKETFGDYTLHLEFRTPYKPFARGQKRGNSGVYHQGRYETQVLDSFGLEGSANETGGIYSIAAPRLNACLPPLSWQTYEIDFTAARWKDGKKIANARITVRLNGVLIHENQELPHATAAAKFAESPEPGPVYLQHHGNPVRYRNIWIVPGESRD